MLLLTQSTQEAGSAAQATAALGDKASPGFVLPASAMAITHADRQEMIDNLVNSLTPKNGHDVEADLRNVLLTVHVPQEVEDRLEEAFEKLEKPVLMRLSPLGAVADPLAPTIVMGLRDMKSVLDALRMLYAEMYTAKNIAASESRSAAVIMQTMPIAVQSYRVIKNGASTIIEGAYGYGAWVGYGEPDRFLFHDFSLVKSEPGDLRGIFWEEEFIEEARRHITDDDAKAALIASAELGDAPLLLARTPDGSFKCLGCLPSVDR